MRRKRLRTALVALLIVAGVAGVIYWDAYCFEPHYPRLYRVTIELPGLGAGLDGMTLAVFSDLHIVGAGPRERRMARLIARANPDAIVGVGDYVEDDGASGVEYTTESCARELATALSWLPSGPQRVACLGNWDFDPVPDVMRATGFRLVEDGPVTLSRGSARLTFLASGDLARGADRAPTIVLSHVPEAADAAARARAGLVLGGHWHGGQVCLPFVGTLGAETAKYPKGLYRVGDTWLYVTRGVGFHTEPVRFFCRSEVTLLTLRSAQ